MPKSASPKNAVRVTEPPLAPVDGSLRYVCVHGHFYQPPRENPWLETVEVQDSAAPYHDWNDRITAECYAPNGASRITNTQNQIIRIMNLSDPLHPSVAQEFKGVTATSRDLQPGVILLANADGIWVLQQHFALDPAVERSYAYKVWYGESMYH